MSKLWRTNQETFPLTEPPAPAGNTPVQADSQPVHFDTTNPASRAPAVYQAGRQNHADLTASGVGRPTGPAPTPPPSDSAGNKHRRG